MTMDGGRDGAQGDDCADDGADADAMQAVPAPTRRVTWRSRSFSACSES